MEERYIPLSVPNFQGKELEYVTNAVKTEWVSTAGSYISDFEKEIAQYVHVPQAAACQSGTAGLHLSLLALKIRAGEEVIVPALTFIASVNPVRYVGAEPVFMDCDDSLTMDPDKLEQFCREECRLDGDCLVDTGTGKKVSALIVVHVFGNLANLDRIMEIARQYHLKVIEDAAEALGSYYTEGLHKGRFAGTIGDIGVYSFNGNKIITTGGGGMVVSQDEKLVERCRFLSAQAKKDAVYFIHEEVGYNYRMTNLQAALGLAQLAQLEHFIEIKRKNYQTYAENGIPLLPFSGNGRSNYWFYSYLSHDRDGLIKFLNQNKVQSRPIWRLIHQLKPYEAFRAYRIETAEKYYDTEVNLSCSTNLSEGDIKETADLIKAFEDVIVCS